MAIPYNGFILAVLLLSAKYGECLHCFQCQNVSEGVDCNIVAECNNGELSFTTITCNNNVSCYIERSGPVNDTRYSLGCMPRQKCPDEHQFTLVGRSVQTHCKKCCSVDGCNKKYCEPVHPTAPKTTLGTCTDSPSENCTNWAALINICSTPHRAKDICRKYCNLCDMVDGSWGDWHDWSTCSTTCGLGVEFRTKPCNDPAPSHGGYDCPGDKNQQRSCFSRACPASNQHPSTESIGRKFLRKVRMFPVSHIVHGGWSVWAKWEGCSEACGTGLKKRHRTCTNPPPSLYGHTCLGDAVDFTLCHGSNCGNHSTPIDGGWADWSRWETCSTSCGPGTTKRARKCSNPPPQNGGKTCSGNNTETNQCTLRACPVHGGWGTWAQWSVCSSSCGQGITRRTRVCDNPRPQLLGNFCFGDSTDFGICLIKPCPVDGGWSDWSLWSSCSLTCGNGHATRKRYCLNPPPANGGLNCIGSQTEQSTCTTANCPVNGGWSAWTSWSSCSSSVARGLSKRQRTCTNSSPSALGRDCNGDSTEQRNCPGINSAFTVSNAAAGLTVGTIRFAHYITNIGGHYNTSTGIFTCKYPGIYVFALHIVKNFGSDSAYCDIRKNGSNVVKAYTLSHSNGYYSTTNSVVMHLVHGDKVDLGGCSPIASLYGLKYTTFSGFLPTAD